MIIATLDPNKAFPDAALDRLVEAAGLIPSFIQDASMVLPEEVTLDQFVKEVLAIYGFGIPGNWLDNGGDITSEGRYLAPEDLPLDPIVSLYCPKQDVMVYVYQYAITGFEKGDDHYVTRMD